MPVDESIRAVGLNGRQLLAEASELFGWDWEADDLLDCDTIPLVQTSGQIGHVKLTHDVDSIGRARKALWVVLNYVGGFEDSLHGASFDVELVVAEAFTPSKHACQLVFDADVRKPPTDVTLTAPRVKNSSR